MNKAVARPSDVKSVRVLTPYTSFEGARRWQVRLVKKVPVTR